MPNYFVSRINHASLAICHELGSSIKTTNHTQYHLNQNENDCISCNKHLTHKLPRKLQCQAICGTTKQHRLLANNN
jgi:hypothetical protein